ncbi:RluA family pseudouridine synthase [Reichenbachiella versicolor]|uniref:RluA family pseudouridine synthase n=1 Tax=Reichenbachiella versicolor TaxID=1821036 RepID=UPI000D6EAD59|nr:RluA family pseudouridine synthase [Reichenbachiella versicolor]
MTESYIVPKGGKPQFLNLLAPKVFKWLASKAKAKKAIASGELKVNGKQVNWDARVFSGDEITFSQKGRQQATPKRKVYQEKIPVIYEDEHLAVLNKPGGIPVNGNQFKTLENALPYNLKPSKEPDALEMIRPLHRLDGPTCGLVMVAKTDRAQVAMGKQFQFKEIRKRYKAVVIGKLKESKGTIEKPIDGKKSTSEYEVLTSKPSAKYKALTLVNLYPVTGRTHQLRIHMSEIGHPVVGDKFYSGNQDVLQGKGLLLCSDKLWFDHPITGEKTEVEIKIPNKFITVMERESQRVQRNRRVR